MADDVIRRVRERVIRGENYRGPVPEGMVLMPAVPLTDLRALLAVAEAARDPLVVGALREFLFRYERVATQLGPLSATAQQCEAIRKTITAVAALGPGATS